MRKRITAIIFVLLLVGSVIWMITEGTKAEVLPIGSKIPKMGLLTQNGKSTISYTSNKTLLIFFSKECPHCEYELNVLNDNIDELQNVRIYFLTIDKDLFRYAFVKKFDNLSNKRNCVFGIVDKSEYKQKFGSMVTPTLYFFNRKGILITKLKGETKFERILKELTK